MKAAILEQVGGPLVVEDIPEPKPRHGEVLVRVAACGVCHTDLHVVKGEVKFPLPCVLGHEISGTIEEVGAGVAGLKTGDRVVGSFIMACGRCVHCVRGRDDLCETFFALNRLKGALYDGETRLHRKNGTPLAMYSMAGLAEYAVTPATGIFPIPDGMSLHGACILGCAIPTAYGAVRHQAELEPGQTVAVIGVGGVGSNIIQIARAFGAIEVIAVDIRDEKLEAARKLGATQVVNASREDPAAQVRALTGDQGVDAAFEALGRPETVLSAFNMVRDGGRVVVVGIAAGTAAVPIEITRLVRRSIRLIGSYGARMRADVPDLIRLVSSGRLDLASPITRRYRLDDADQAYGALNRGEITGRAIVVVR
ncbi:MAG TPA: zinc-binding dehydrogenase [Methylomirabilota bacterium]|nr:zinc-binding dehydrogenase [Methylomirabilota bacterium]